MTDTTAQPAPTTALPPLVERVQAPDLLPEPPTELGLRWRPLDRADASALHGLLAAIEEGDATPHRTDPVEVEEKFDGAWKDMARNSRGGWDDDGVLRAYGTAEVRPGDTTVVRAFLDGGVHPAWRGRGLGRAVLAWQTARGRQLLAASGKELPARLAVHADEEATGHRRLLAAAGMEPRRYYRTMRRDLSAPLPEVEVEPGLRVAPWSPDLDEAVRLAHNDAFRDHWGSEPATPESWATGRSKFAPAWSFAVVDDTVTGDTAAVDGSPTVVAYAMSSRFEQDWAVVGYTSGYTAALGVRRAYRGRRLAPALLAASMAAFRADGLQYAELDVDTENPSGAHDLYRRLGYEVRHGSVMYSVEL